MAAKIKLLRSTIAGHVPAALESGQVAINEADGKLFWRDAGTGAVRAMDLTLIAYATQTWVTAQLTAAINALKGGAPAAYDTLIEIANWIAADQTAEAGMTTAIGNRLRLDAAGGYDTTQQAQGRSNLGLGDSATRNVGTGAGTVAAGDDGRIAGAVQKTGDETVAGVKTFSSIPVGPAADPTTADQLARKGYVDNKVAAITSGQPIPTSSSDYGVGSVLFLILVTSGTSVANNATVAGSALRIPGSVSDDWTVNYNPGLSGTWKNISGGTIGYTGTGYFVRTA